MVINFLVFILLIYIIYLIIFIFYFSNIIINNQFTKNIKLN